MVGGVKFSKRPNQEFGPTQSVNRPRGVHGDLVGVLDVGHDDHVASAELAEGAEHGREVVGDPHRYGGSLWNLGAVDLTSVGSACSGGT